MYIHKLLVPLSRFAILRLLTSAYCIDVRHFECIHMYKYRQHYQLIVWV